MLTLGTLSKNTSGKIIGFCFQDDSYEDLAKKLIYCGFFPGADFEVVYEAPFSGDPIVVHIGNATVSLRRKEANFIEVTV